MDATGVTTQLSPVPMRLQTHRLLEDCGMTTEAGLDRLTAAGAMERERGLHVNLRSDCIEDSQGYDKG